MEDMAAFWRRVKDEPDNHTARLVFADYLDERFQPQLAFAMRWSGFRGRFPLVTPARRYASWATLLRGQHKPAHGHQLPRAVFEKLKGSKVGLHIRYAGVEYAFYALSVALERLRAVLDPTGDGVK